MTKKAFIIGANTEGLKYAASDAYLMRNCLEIHGFEITHPKPETGNILKLFKKWVDSWQTDDTVIFYFSGHGMAPEFKGQLQLIIEKNARSEQSRIDIAQITRPFERNTAKNKLIILDCCRSGAAQTDWAPEKSENYRLLTAGRMLEKTKELDTLRAGFLTFRFHEALTVKCPELMDNNGILGISAVYEHIKKQAVEHNNASDEKIPEPCLLGNQGDDFPIGAKALVPEKIEAAVSFLMENFPEIPKSPILKGWPNPVQAAVNRLFRSTGPEDYINMLEAFAHFHFVAIASMFYWSLSEKELSRPGEEILPGLYAISHTLRDSSCCGAPFWVEKAGLVSWSMHRIKGKKIAFDGLAAILEPDQLEPEKENFPENLAPPRSGALPYRITGRGKVWKCMAGFAEIRRHLIPGMILKDDLAQSLKNGLVKMFSWITHLFRPYLELELAMASVTELDGDEDHVGIQCVWDEDGFYCVNNEITRENIFKIWNRPPPEKNMTTPAAPKPPRPGWNWDDSLLLYDPENPYKKNVYLMPLGFRHPGPESMGKNDDFRIPGLLDSVRWKKNNKVGAVFQRTYQKGLPMPGWQIFRQAGEGIRKASHLIRAIEEICRTIEFDIPSPSEISSEVPPVFDLEHHRIAERNARNTITRSAEMERVLNFLWKTNDQRLILQGASGTGKSVLLSQIFLRNRQNSVFISMEAASGLRHDKVHETGMYCLDRLCFFLGVSRPAAGLPPDDIARKMRDCLNLLASRHGYSKFMIILDGLNLATDPAGVLSFLPEPFPGNFFVLVSSQPQERVKKALRVYGAHPWPEISITPAKDAEARRMVLKCWTMPSEKGDPPREDELPAPLIERICGQSRGIPVLLANWAGYLRDLWFADPSGFQARAEKMYARHADNKIPEFWETRFEKVKKNFMPGRLPDAMMLCFYLIPRALTIEEMQMAIKEVRRLGIYDDLPPVSARDIENGLIKYDFAGGFLQREINRDMEPCWAPVHESIAGWFMKGFDKEEILPRLRLALASLGAVILPENALSYEFEKWIKWVEEGHENFRSLYPEAMAGICLSLMGHFSAQSPEYWIALATEVFVRLSETGEQMLGFRRQSELEAGLEQKGLPLHVRREILVSLGDIHYKQNRLDKALSCYEESLEIRRGLFEEADTPQTREDLLFTAKRLASLQKSMNIMDRALENQQWTPEIWQNFRIHVWDLLTSTQKQDILNDFPQNKNVNDSLNEKDTMSRPTLGFVIAACQLAKRHDIVSTFIDFEWWKSSATMKEQENEQLENLDRDKHEWGIVRHNPPFLLKLGENPDVSQDRKKELEWGLSMTVSLSKEEKQRVIKSYVYLSSAQVNDLLRIFKEERLKFAVLGPYDQIELGKLVNKIWQQ